MKNKIHFNTIYKYFKENYNLEIDEQKFANNKTGAVYNVLHKKGTDIAVFTEKGDGSFICIDSNGDGVNKNNIFGYVSGSSVAYDNHGSNYVKESLVLHFGNELVDNQVIEEKEKQLYPDRTSIVLTAMMRGCHNETEFTSFYVDEVKHVSKKEFDEIRQGLCSEILKKYSEKSYGYISDGMHGILIMSINGDGILVDTEGTDYARYMSYAPQIDIAIKGMLKREFAKKAIHEMKMYVPLQILAQDGDNGEKYKVDGDKYFDKIKIILHRDEVSRKERGLAEHLTKMNICHEKVYRIMPNIEKVDDAVMGVVTINITEPLNCDELEDLKSYISFQFSDDWGLCFRQQEIFADGKALYVHFWNKDDYFIKTEEELFMEPEQNMEMQGIQGIGGMQ